MNRFLMISLLASAATAPVTSGVAEADLESRIDVALDAAVRFLLDAQSPDGAWRSQVYGCFRDDPALTPLVLSSLGPLVADSEEHRTAVHGGVSYLVAMVDEQGSIRPPSSGLAFPVYTAASASWAVMMDSPTEEHTRAQRAWVQYLLRYRLGSDLGWQPSDPQFGGWGYAPVIPRKVEGASSSETPFESNLSATLFGLAALRLGPVPLEDAAYGEVRLFVQRCQNFREDLDQADSAYDDGGFFFTTSDAARNKAGLAGLDRFGRTRFRSYGSATADGLRGLLLCGLPRDHPRVAAARRWLERHFVESTNPGTFGGDREVLQNATYYYYCWSVAHAFLALNLDQIEQAAGPVYWADKLAVELLDRQRPDGSWANRFTDSKEDDPLVATPFAVAALAICRRMVSDE